MKYEQLVVKLSWLSKIMAYKIAVSDEPIFKVENFKEQITKEQKVNLI